MQNAEKVRAAQINVVPLHTNAGLPTDMGKPGGHRRGRRGADRNIRLKYTGSCICTGDMVFYKKKSAGSGKVIKHEK